MPKAAKKKAKQAKRKIAAPVSRSQQKRVAAQSNLKPSSKLGSTARPDKILPRRVELKERPRPVKPKGLKETATHADQIVADAIARREPNEPVT